MTYDLNDNVKDSFNFKMDGFIYIMKYPTLNEITEVQKIMEKEEDNLKFIDAISKFITSDNKDAPNIVETLKTKNIKVLQNFVEMIKVEFIGEA